MAPRRYPSSIRLLDQEDIRVRVELDVPRLPWPLRFYFLQTAEGEWENIGFEIGGPIKPTSGPLTLESIKPAAVRWLQENFFKCQAEARSRLDARRQAPPRRGERVSDELVARVAAEYKHLGGKRGAVDFLAKTHGVSRTTIWRWLDRAGVANKRERKGAPANPEGPLDQGDDLTRR